MSEALAYQETKLKRNNFVNAYYTRDGIVTIIIWLRLSYVTVIIWITCWNSFLILTLKMNLSMMHLLIYQVSQYTKLDFIPLEFALF